MGASTAHLSNGGDDMGEVGSGGGGGATGSSAVGAPAGAAVDGRSPDSRLAFWREVGCAQDNMIEASLIW